MKRPDAEASLQTAIIPLFAQLGYETADCMIEYHHNAPSVSQRSKLTEVVILPRLQSALTHLNPTLPPEAIQNAIKEITKDRSVTNVAYANREIYHLIKNGVQVEYKNERGDNETTTVNIIDWKNPNNNEYFLASEFFIYSDDNGTYKRRADLIGFVNGLPLIFIELKAHHRNLQRAYKDNLTDYRDTIPQLFWYNVFLILSNGTQAVIGSTTAQWEHFGTWKRSDNENDIEKISLETLINGTCKPEKLLDITENFILYKLEKSGLVKFLAKNHQYLGVNKAIAAVENIQNQQGKLGVFWHTQGSGKSYSMQFFSEKVLRKLPGNWTFLIVTDREDLDGQIYKNFADTGAVTEAEEQVRAQNSQHLKQLLKENHRYLFTLIQKFRTKKGEVYPQISDRNDIIVIVDEAHRSQYDTFARNMRSALPNASFIGFTGTPLIKNADETTRREFGDYVSIYNFKQSIEDKATVPLYYENRIPEVQLTNQELNDDIIQIIEESELDENQEQNFAQKFIREYEIITRKERLETMAKDIVSHFMTRGYQGKAMVISIDRFTAVKMYNNVQKYWQDYLNNLKSQLTNASEFEQKKISKQIHYMENTDMAVIISSSQNEIKDFQDEGLDIKPHRERLIKEDLEEKFKNSNNPLRIVFVCAMWMTGFDVPSCSTIYLDKPMKNHNLMQTIARANRVYGDKVNGLIVDYIGIFRELKKALEIYGSDSDGRIKEGEYPVKEKEELVKLLEEALTKAIEFCQARDVDINLLLQQENLFEYLYNFDQAAQQLVDAQIIESLDDSLEKIIINDDLKREFIFHANNVARIYKAILPDRWANQFIKQATLFTVLADKIRAFADEDIDISFLNKEMKDILDESITPLQYVIQAAHHTQLIDISQIDIEKIEQLRNEFNNTRHQRSQLEKLRGSLNRQIKQMVNFNKKRVNYAEKFQQLIDDYNAGSRNIEITYQQLLNLIQDLSQEAKRAISQGLTEEELAVFDLLFQPNLTETEEKQVKKIAKDLLKTLKAQKKLVKNWRDKEQSKSDVRSTINDVLYDLPDSYTDEVFDQVYEAVYQHIFQSYYGDGRSIYGDLA